MTDTPWLGDASSLVERLPVRGALPGRGAARRPSRAIDGSDLNTFSYVDRDAAVERAKSADVSLPFGGVPVGIKELDVRRPGGRRTEASLVFKDRIATSHLHDAGPRCSAAGGVQPGRPDHGVGVRRAQRLHHEAQRHHPQPVAARPHGRRLVGRVGGGGGRRPRDSIATGGDGGGSIRIPAAFNGLPRA